MFLIKIPNEEDLVRKKHGFEGPERDQNLPCELATKQVIRGWCHDCFLSCVWYKTSGGSYTGILMSILVGLLAGYLHFRSLTGKELWMVIPKSCTNLGWLKPYK